MRTLTPKKPTGRRARTVRKLASTQLILEVKADSPEELHRAIAVGLMAPPSAMAFCEAEYGANVCTRVPHGDDLHVAHYSDGTIAKVWKEGRS